MMTDRERDRFKQEVLAMAAVAHARHGEAETMLRPVFRRARDRHPDEEHYLFELWDQVTLRRMI